MKRKERLILSIVTDGMSGSVSGDIDHRLGLGDFEDGWCTERGL
jgi:hypothetical protein